MIIFAITLYIVIYRPNMQDVFKDIIHEYEYLMKIKYIIF